MSNSRWDDAALQSAFREPSEQATRLRECPPAEALTQAARGQRMSDAELAVLDHVASCAACTVAWIVARDAPTSTTARVDTTSSWRWIVAAAAAVTVVVGGWSLRHVVGPVTPQVVQREVERSTIASTLGADAPLARDQFTLRWTALPDATYDLTVSDENLAIVFVANGLAIPEAQVPADALRSYAAGQRLLWQVTAVAPNGARVKSTTFSARLR